MLLTLSGEVRNYLKEKKVPPENSLKMFFLLLSFALKISRFSILIFLSHFKSFFHFSFLLSHFLSYCTLISLFSFYAPVPFSFQFSYIFHFSSHLSSFLSTSWFNLIQFISGSCWISIRWILAIDESSLMSDPPGIAMNWIIESGGR